MVKISVITITYNAAATLGRTVDSVLTQTYPYVEHLIVDGASTDNTLIVAKDYSERSYAASNGHDVRIMSEPDNGLYDAMNKGLRYATGDYVVFLNAGDFFPNSGTLQTVADAANVDVPENMPAVVYGDTDIVDNEGKYICHRRLTPPENLTWRSFRHGMLVCHQAFYARTDIAKTIPYNTEYRYSADVDWCIRIMKKAEEMGLPLVNVHQTVANYTREGETTRHHKASLKERFHVMAHHYGTAHTVMMHLWFVLRRLLNY